MKVKLLPSGFLFSPSKVMDRFEGLIQKHGLEKALKSNKYQEGREAWIASLFALGLSSRFETDYWIETPEKDPPDVRLIRYAKHPLGNSQEKINLEICEWEGHSKFRNLTNLIRSKLAAKKYPSYFTLLVFVHDRRGSFKPMEIHEELKNEKIHLAEIWLPLLLKLKSSISEGKVANCLS